MDEIVTWYDEDQDRYNREIKRLEQLAITVQVNEEAKASGLLQLELSVPKKNGLGVELDAPLKLTAAFPDNYPYFKPEVFASGLELARHQNPLSGNLCLSPRGSESWDVDELLGDYLKKQLALNLKKGAAVNDEEIAGDPLEQAEPISEYFKQNENFNLFSDLPPFEAFPPVANARNRPDELVNEGTFNFFLTNYSKDFQFGPQRGNDLLKFTVSTWKNVSGKVISSLQPRFVQDQKAKYTGYWYRINLLPMANEKRFELLKKIISTKGLAYSGLREKIKFKDEVIDSIIALSILEEIAPGRYGWGLVFVILSRKGRSDYQRFVSPIRVGQQEYMVRIPKLRVLTNKNVSIAGLGSLGGPSAIELARNGVGNLRLLDYDIIEPGSSVRSALGHEYSGIYKTHAVKAFINRNYPYTEVKVFNHFVGTPRSRGSDAPPEQKVMEGFLTDSSLLLDATGDIAVSNFLFSQAWTRSLPYICIEGRPGVWGGLVMRYIPNTAKGCWMCLRHHINENTISPPPQDPNANVQTGGCGDITFLGTSFELQNIVTTAIGLVVSTLCRDTDGGYEDVNWDVAILSLVDDTGKMIPPEWKPYKLSRHPKCHYCSEV